LRPRWCARRPGRPEMDRWAACCVRSALAPHWQLRVGNLRWAGQRWCEVLIYTATPHFSAMMPITLPALRFTLLPVLSLLAPHPASPLLPCVSPALRKPTCGPVGCCSTEWYPTSIPSGQVPAAPTPTAGSALWACLLACACRCGGSATLLRLMRKLQYLQRQCRMPEGRHTGGHAAASCKSQWGSASHADCIACGYLRSRGMQACGGREPHPKAAAHSHAGAHPAGGLQLPARKEAEVGQWE